MTSHVFIDRPIMASVVSLVIVVMGLLSVQFLPVAQFPEITPPVVQIDADYPGASAEVVRKYCICMNEKMDSNETRSISQWEKANPAARAACDKESGWK